MAKKTHKTLRIAPSNEELLAQDRHTQWQVDQERGATRNGRAYLSGGFQGHHKTKAARSRKACRGRVAR